MYLCCVSEELHYIDNNYLMTECTSKGTWSESQESWLVSKTIRYMHMSIPWIRIVRVLGGQCISQQHTQPLGMSCCPNGLM